MPTYNPPLRDMQFVMHELLHVVDELKTMPAHADMDSETINAVLEEGGKFAAEVTFGQACRVTRNLAARACRWWSTRCSTKCSTAPTRPGPCTPV